MNNTINNLKRGSSPWEMMIMFSFFILSYILISWISHPSIESLQSQGEPVCKKYSEINLSQKFIQLN